MSETNIAAASERVEAILSRYREQVLRGMRAALHSESPHIGLIRYHLGWQDADGSAIEGRAGKMLRPALCLLSCEAAGADINSALPAAVALELLHNFTLIHDDIEDGSETRHGRPTLWKVAGVAQAINAGDGLFAIAQRTMLRLSDAGVPAERVLAAAAALNDASVALCEGQHADLGFERRASVSLAEYESMIRGKSAVLIAAAAEIGALVAAAGSDVAQGFSRYGLAVGLGFQIQDDVLGIWGSPDHTGKSAGDDIRARKKSFPIVHAFDHLDADGQADLVRIFGADSVADAGVARVVALLEQCGARDAATSAARRYSDEALAALVPLRIAPERRGDLEALAKFAVERVA